MSYNIDKLRESELTEHLKKEEQELSLIDHLREVTEEKQTLERQLEEARTYATDYGFELGRKKEELEEAKQNIYKFSELALIEGISFGYSWEDFKLYVLDKQLKEKGDE